MDGEGFKAALLQLDLAQRAFARMVRVNERRVRDWANGQGPLPVRVQFLLELALMVQAKAPDVEVQAWLRAAADRLPGMAGKAARAELVARVADPAAVRVEVTGAGGPGGEDRGDG